MRRRITARTLRSAALCTAVAVSVWGAYYYIDWFLFYVQRGHIVRDLDGYASALRQTGLPMEAAGTLEYDGEHLPLWVVRKPALHANSRTVCLMGSIHGNEPAGAQTLLELSQDMARHPEPYAHLNYVLLPMANPWGWARDLRRNADNQDIAREFISVQAAVATIATKAGMAHASRPPQGVWAVPEADFQGIRLTTASLWAREQGVPLAFIVEVHDGHDLAQRVKVHATAVEELTRLLATAP